MAPFHLNMANDVGVFLGLLSMCILHGPPTLTHHVFLF